MEILILPPIAFLRYQTFKLFVFPFVYVYWKKLPFLSTKDLMQAPNCTYLFWIKTEYKYKVYTLVSLIICNTFFTGQAIETMLNLSRILLNLGKKECQNIMLTVITFTEKILITRKWKTISVLKKKRKTTLDVHLVMNCRRQT